MTDPTLSYKKEDVGHEEGDTSEDTCRTEDTRWKATAHTQQDLKTWRPERGLM
jgi:hypothetical protein